MQLLIKQRVFSWLDSYNIYDEMQQKKYYVKSEVFTLGHRMHLYDLNGRELGRIKQELFTLTPRFEIEAKNGIHGEIKKKFTLFKPAYEINYNGYKVEGNFLGWNYDVLRDGENVMHIKKEYFSWGDTYVIDIKYPQDEILGLLLVLSIDAANCDKNNAVSC